MRDLARIVCDRSLDQQTILSRKIVSIKVKSYLRLAPCLKQALKVNGHSQSDIVCSIFAGTVWTKGGSDICGRVGLCNMHAIECFAHNLDYRRLTGIVNEYIGSMPTYELTHKEKE